MKLKPLSEESLKRLEVVRFALIIRHFEESGDNIFTQTIIETICQMTNAKITNINYLKTYVKTAGRPQPLELGILNELYGVPYRTLCSLGRFTSRTIKSKLDEYLNMEVQHPLYLTLEEEMITDIIAFNEGYKKLFNQATYLSKDLMKG